LIENCDYGHSAAFTVMRYCDKATLRGYGVTVNAF
jgi:hypothetical protein